MSRGRGENIPLRTFINNSLNAESLHNFLQQREDKIAVFEVNTLIVKRDAQTRVHTTLSLFLSLSRIGNILEKGLAISNYWGGLVRLNV